MASTAKQAGDLVVAGEWVTGMRAKGEFRCAECGYGVTVYRSLPSCPMCHGSQWERVPWRPYSRSLARPGG